MRFTSGARYPPLKCATRWEDAPSYSAVRATLRILEEKGHIKHQAEGLKYVYVPTVNRDKAKRSAIKHLLDTFFNESPEQVVAALLDVSARRLTAEELDRIAFENGALVGPDKFDSYDSIAGRLQAQRDISQAVAAGNWSKLEEIVAAGDGDAAISGMYARNYRLFFVSTARGSA